jgi:hypothetical protein
VSVTKVKLGMIWNILRGRPVAYLIRFEPRTVIPIGGGARIVSCQFIGKEGAGNDND